MTTSTGQYERPAVLASFATDELISDAAGCFAVTCGDGGGTKSDGQLKEDVTVIRSAVQQLKDIGTRSS